MTKPLRKTVIFGYGIGHFLNDLCAALWFTYFLVFYTLVLGFDDSYAGAGLLIGQIADAIATPVVGLWSDKSSLCILDKLGKRKSWYFLGTMMVLLSIPFIYSPCIGFEQTDDIIRLTYYSIFIIIFQFGWAAVQTVHLALASDLTYKSQERTQLFSLRNTFTVLSNLTVYIIALVVLKTGEKGSKLDSSNIISFQIVVSCIIAIGGTSSIIFFFTVKEQRFILKERKRSSLAASRSWFLRWPLYHVALIYMTTRIYCNVVMTLIPLYLQQSLHLSTYTIASVPLTMYVASLIASLLSGYSIKYLGKRNTYYIGVVLGIIGCVWVEFDSSDFYKKYAIYFVAGLLGGATSLVLVVALAICADLIGVDVDNGAFIYGLMSFVDKLSCGIVIMIIQGTSQKTESFYLHSFALTNGSAIMFGGISVLTLKKSVTKQRDYSVRGESTVDAGNVEPIQKKTSDSPNT